MGFQTYILLKTCSKVPSKCRKCRFRDPNFKTFPGGHSPGAPRIVSSLFEGAVYMGGGTGRLPGRDVKRDLAKHVYICYLSRSVYMERILPGRFSPRPGKAGSRFAQPGSRLKRDNFYHINAPSRFAGTILC